jgi:hypothetical protein
MVLHHMSLPVPSPPPPDALWGVLCYKWILPPLNRTLHNPPLIADCNRYHSLSNLRALNLLSLLIF